MRTFRLLTMAAALAWAAAGAGAAGVGAGEDPAVSTAEEAGPVTAAPLVRRPGVAPADRPEGRWFRPGPQRPAKRTPSPTTRPDEEEVWLGIEVDAVPLPLRAHLGREESAVMIRNVFRRSPADKAGLARFDVIVAMDGETVSPDPALFTRHVRGRRPGDSIRLTIVRGGTTKEITIRLERRPGTWSELERKYPDEPRPEPYDFRGRILRPGPGGWTWEDLGPIAAPGEVAERLRSYLEGRIEAPEYRLLAKDGRVVIVRRRPDGTIEVKSYQYKEGENTARTRTYADENALAAGDPEAADLLKAAESQRCEVERPAHPRAVPPEVRRHVEEALRQWHDRLRATDDMLQDLERRTEDYRRSIRQWRQWLQEAIGPQGSGDRWEQWRERFFQGPLSALRPPPAPPPAAPGPGLPPGGPCEAPGRPPGEPPPPAPPQVRFEKQADGSIVVHLRDGETELTRSYPSEQAMKEQAAALFERYEAIQRHFR